MTPAEVRAMTLRDFQAFTEYAERYAQKQRG